MLYRNIKMKLYQKIITWTLLPVLTGFLGWSLGHNYPRKFKEPSTAQYFDFSKMSQLNIPSDKVNIPNSLENLIEHLSDRSTKISYLREFHCEVLKVAEELGYTKQKINVLGLSELIKLSTEIVEEKLTYDYVDSDPVFIKKHGANLPIDHYFYLGKGDCDKYADLTIATYNFLKSMNSNPKNKNVYLTRDIGGEFPNHAWVTVVVGISPNEIHCTHIDPTFADNGGKLEATTEHVNPDYFEFKFFYWLGTRGGYVKSNQLIDDLLVEETDNQKIAKLMAGKAENLKGLKNNLEAAMTYEKAAHLTDSDDSKGLWLRNACLTYFKEGKDSNVIEITKYAKENALTTTMFYTPILATAIKSSKRIGDSNLAQQYLNELLTEYPDDVYTKEFK